MTKYQIFLTFYHFLNEEYCKNSDRSEEFKEYLGCINPYLWTDGKTADPSYYDEFMEIADTLFEGEDCTVDEGYVYAGQYLEELSRRETEEYGSGISEVMAVFGECTPERWNGIAAKLREYKTRKRRCACCGCYTLDESEGRFEICPVCFWEDDAVQNNDPEFAGGANKVCLRVAQENFEEFGACTESAIPFVREPDAEEISGIIREPDEEDED
ncbi:MAG: hypothetical protein MJ079_00995 [Ruminococcus sp.]|nr:hypothetical protein [Ruminococcus sp.]